MSTVRKSLPKVLEVDLLSKSFGGLKALGAVSMHIHKNEIVALIGPNGAGKTTFFNCITGMYQPDTGSTTLYQQNIPRVLTGKKPSQITEFGMARTFQNIRLFDQLTVIENVMVGSHTRLKSNFLSAIFKTKNQQVEEKNAIAEAFQLLERMGLKDRANLLAGNLAYADQRRLEIARALATKPEVLLLDEPAAGMNHSESRELDQLILNIKNELSISILLIEHDMKLVMKVSDRIYVMDRGEKIAEGSPLEIRENPKVIAAYLGEEIIGEEGNSKGGSSA